MDKKELYKRVNKLYTEYEAFLEEIDYLHDKAKKLMNQIEEIPEGENSFVDNDTEEDIDE